MENVFNEVRRFLESKTTKDDFYQSEAIVWIDWREYDEDIISYFNRMMEEYMKVELLDNGQPYGNDIVLVKEDKKLQIPYKNNEMDRDTTIKYLNEFIKPEYDIRWFMESLGSDTLGFVVLKSEDWKKLYEEFGKENLNFYFKIIDKESKMFDLDIDEVFDMIEIRSKNK